MNILPYFQYYGIPRRIFNQGSDCTGLFLRNRSDLTVRAQLTQGVGYTSIVRVTTPNIFKMGMVTSGYEIRKNKPGSIDSMVKMRLGV